jgi:hypothetical protein
MHPIFAVSSYQKCDGFFLNFASMPCHIITQEKPYLKKNEHGVKS